MKVNNLKIDFKLPEDRLNFHFSRLRSLMSAMYVDGNYSNLNQLISDFSRFVSLMSLEYYGITPFAGKGSK